MQRFAAFIMRGPVNAGAVAVATLLLGLGLPPLAWLSSAVVGLVVLRFGASAVLRVVVPAIIGLAVAGALALGQGVPVALTALAAWLPTLVLAQVLRQRIRLGDALLVACGLGWLGVVVLALWLDNPGTWWQATLLQALPPEQWSGRFGLTVAQFRQRVELAAPLMNGVLAASTVLSAVTSLLLARWWQALLYNPGGFGREFRALRLGRSAAGIVLGLCVVTLATAAPVIGGLALVALAVYLFQGLAVVHGVIEARGMETAWVVAFYAALVILMSFVVLGLVLLAASDAWVDYRHRWAKDTG